MRFGAVLSLGRIGTGAQTRAALERATRDRHPNIAQLARLGLKRHQLIPRWTKRVHVNIFDADLIRNPNDEGSPYTLVREGTPFVVHRYNVGGRERPTTNVYDFVQLVETGEVGYLTRESLAGMYMI